MFLTEAQAKQRWCPFARQMAEIRSEGGTVRGPVAGFSANRFNDGQVTFCVGAGCMAWRWIDIPPGTTDEERLSLRERGVPSCEPARGFCGLAGDPIRRPQLVYMPPSGPMPGA